MTELGKWGLKDNPYATFPIRRDSLDLFVGRKREAELCSSILGSKSIIVIEGSRGVGTTSFGNYIRFSRMKQELHLTPSNEISIGAGWNSEILLANILSSLVWELEKDTEVEHDAKFKEIMAVTKQVRESFQNISIQLSILGSGGGIGRGKQSVITSPPVYPIHSLIQYLLEAKEVCSSVGYPREIITQINNLDVGTTLSDDQLAFFLNDIRDILQVDGFSWLLVGDLGLRKFITDKVDRVDDIVSFELTIEPLSLEEVLEAVDRRVRKYASHHGASAPLSEDLIEALYLASDGRISQIFGLATRLLNLTSQDNLIERVTLDVALPILKELVEDRIRLHRIPSREEEVLRYIATGKDVTPGQISKEFGIARPNVSRSLGHLSEARLITYARQGRYHLYNALPDVKMAYGSK